MIDFHTGNVLILKYTSASGDGMGCVVLVHQLSSQLRQLTWENFLLPAVTSV